MTRCDNCDRATFATQATTFADADIVLCKRASCETLAEEAKLLYYEHGANNLRGELGL